MAWAYEGKFVPDKINIFNLFKMFVDHVLKIVRINIYCLYLFVK